MDFVNELCNLHDYIEGCFENAEFISAETPLTKWSKEKVAIKFTSNGRQYKYCSCPAFGSWAKMAWYWATRLLTAEEAHK